MHRFTIWAPDVKGVAVKVNGAVIPMRERDDQGTWQVEVNDAEPGTEYGYLVDEDAACYPDPRSQWQPNGVHGLSRLYDQNAFSWTDGKCRAVPLAIAVIYELHIGTFTDQGTLDSAIERLDYLIDLGVTHVELMP